MGLVIYSANATNRWRNIGAINVNIKTELNESMAAADHPDFKLPDYLDSLAQSLSVDGKPHTAKDIRSAADEIRKLTQKVDQMAAGMAAAASREDQLASALFELIEDRVQSLIETELDNYDPTDHHNFTEAVAEQTAHTSTEDMREAVAEVIKTGYFDVTFSS